MNALTEPRQTHRHTLTRIHKAEQTGGEYIGKEQHTDKARQTNRQTETHTHTQNRAESGRVRKRKNAPTKTTVDVWVSDVWVSVVLPPLS